MTKNIEQPGCGDVNPPGSPKAVAAGCRCGVHDNNRGRGWQFDGGRAFWVNGNCPVHWSVPPTGPTSPGSAQNTDAAQEKPSMGDYAGLDRLSGLAVRWFGQAGVALLIGVISVLVVTHAFGGDRFGAALRINSNAAPIISMTKERETLGIEVSYLPPNGTANEGVCREPKPIGSGGQDDREYRDNGLAIIMKDFAELPEPDKRNVMSGALFVVGVLGLVTYLAITRK